MTSASQPSLPFMAIPRLYSSDRTPIRRCVRRVRLQPDPDGTYVFRARSFTREKGRVYHCRINPLTGDVWCGCRDFEFRKGPMAPTLDAGPLCKHLTRAAHTVRQVERQRTRGSCAS